MIKLSVIIPLYNAEKYIGECLESIVKQELRDIEVIVINDGSIDKSLQIVETYALKYDFIKVITQANQGVSVARNKGLEMAHGEYVFFVDSDDYIEEHTLQYCYQMCKANALDILTFDAETFLDSHYETDYWEEYYRGDVLKQQVYTGEDFFNISVETGKYRVPVYINIYSKEYLDSNKLRFKESVFFEDNLFTPMALIGAKKIMYIDKIFYKRRIRTNSIITTVDKNGKNGIFILEICKELYLFYIKNNKKFTKRTQNNFKIILRDLYYTLFKQSDQEKKFNRISICESLDEMKEIANRDLLLLAKYPIIYYKQKTLKENIKKIVNR